MSSILSSNLKVMFLSEELESEYVAAINATNKATFYSTIKYRNFLRKVLPNSKDYYLLAIQEGVIVGVIPFFITLSENGEKIANSLPFYGGYGALICMANKTDEDEVRQVLFEAYKKMLIQEKISASCIITSPFDEIDLSNLNMKVDYTEERVCQVTFFDNILSSSDIASDLMTKFHYKTRNMIRKGLRSGFQISHDFSMCNLTKLYGIHKENMRVIGGNPKGWNVFQAIYDIYEYDTDYRIYIAKKNNEVAAALLVFYHKKTVEYYTPVINQKYRSDQPLSYLIYEVMIDAIKRSFEIWNWGGTWASQVGVYRFKKRWAATDLSYFYYGQIFDKKLYDQTPDALLEKFPYYYVRPF